MRKIAIALSLLLLWACNSDKFSDDRFQFKQTNNQLEISNERSLIRLSVINDQVIQVNYFPNKKIVTTDTTLSVVLKPSSTSYTVKTYADSLVLTTAKLKAVFNKQLFAVNFFTAEGKPLLQATQSYTDEGSSKKVAFKAWADDHFYGMGQKSISVDRRGYAFENFNQHIGGYTQPYATMQINIPYVYSPVGWGVLFDNDYPAHFDMAKSNPNEWTYQVENGSLCMYITAGTDENELLKKYYDLTGYQPMLPKWAYGLLQSKCAYENDQQVYSIVEKFAKRQLPLDAIILDAYWFGGYKENYPKTMGNFTWLTTNFPNAQQYLDSLHKMGVKTILINEPYINLASENYPMLNKNGWLVKQKGSDSAFVFSPFWCGDASLFDITNPQAQQWLWGKFRDVMAMGVDGLWIDLIEPEHPVVDGVFYKGDWRRVHNIYGLTFAKVLYEGLEKDFPDKRMFNLSRAGYTGMQRYGVVNWSGDASKTWNALKMQIPMLVGTVASGIANFSSDIGGFTNAHDRRDGMTLFTNFNGKGVLTTGEMYTRWFQHGVFSPILRPHSGEEQYCEPFAFDARTEKITSDFLRLRYRLIPFIYSYAFKTHSTGETLIKPLFFEFAETGARACDNQYLFGREFLVAPVVDEKQFEKSVYLPRLEKSFRWIDFWTDTPYPGGDSINIPTPIDKIPVFIQQPSIFPMAEVVKYVGQTNDERMELEVYPGGAAEFELYEDDGVTRNYAKGERSIITLKTAMQGNKLSIQASPATGSYKGQPQTRIWTVHVHLAKQSGQVRLNGVPVDASLMSFDAAKSMLTIEVKAPISKGFAMEIDGLELM